MKDGEKPASIGFDLTPIEVGIDEDGESITSCTVEYKVHTARTGEITLKGFDKILMELVDDYPELSSDALKIIFIDKRKEEKPEPCQDTMNRSFNRSLASLIEKGKVFMDGEIVRAGHGTLSGHLKDMSLQTEEQEDGTDMDIPLRGCPDVPADCLGECTDNEDIPDFDY